LLLFAALLVILILYLAVRLVRSYAVIRRVNTALQSANEHLEHRVEERTRELKVANTKLEETFRQLVMSEKLASIGEITAGVAHEINNPVAVIQGNVDVMRMTLGTF
ncbi:histidine kinase dimerization/phospho-acceptor domain-containing protein, partial [Burkholderia sp. SIMBA_052]|uniref:histidine kinase dimerization/phospho-acceptor domain-containing protein n=1 Tax=Burkholderia sp. SIMBA_052 TaxID=3085793 RepID=UPI00397C6650